jgi:hypothetical protein
MEPSFVMATMEVDALFRLDSFRECAVEVEVKRHEIKVQNDQSDYSDDLSVVSHPPVVMSDM